MRHDTGRLEATSACSGEAPNGGVARFLAAAVRCNSGDGPLADSLHGPRGKRVSETRHDAGDEEARRGRRGLAKSPGNAEMRPQANGTPASYSSSLAALFGWGKEGKCSGGEGFIDMETAGGQSALTARNRGEKSSGFPELMNR